MKTISPKETLIAINVKILIDAGRKEKADCPMKECSGKTKMEVTF